MFEGLDTICEVFLQGQSILQSDNMFLGHRISIKDFLRQDGDNVLTIQFASALEEGRKLEKLHDEHRFIAHNGETGRLAVRKAQYHWVSIVMCTHTSAKALTGLGLGSSSCYRWTMETCAPGDIQQSCERPTDGLYTF